MTRLQVDRAMAEIRAHNERIRTELAPAKRGRRYHVCVFPSLYGTPWRTDSFTVAVLFAILRYLGNIVSGSEVRVIDRQKHRHPIVW